jgi:hypothetical protein
MDGQGHARRMASQLLTTLRRRRPGRPAVTLDMEREYPAAHGIELRIRQGDEDAAVFLFDSGAIVVQTESERLRARLQRWKEAVVEKR